MLKNKTGDHPYRCIIKTDNTMDVCGNITVIPWTQMVFFQQGTACIFKTENPGRVNASTEKKRDFSKQMGKRSDDAGHAINRKHPDRSLSDQAKIFFSEAFGRCKQDFKTPACESADQKIFFHDIPP